MSHALQVDSLSSETPVECPKFTYYTKRWQLCGSTEMQDGITTLQIHFVNFYPYYVPIAHPDFLRV